MKQKTKGVIAIIIASFGFALMSIFVRLAGDLPVVEKVWFRNIVSLFVAGYMVHKRNGIYFGSKNNIKILLLRSILGSIGMLLFFYSLGKLPTSDASMLNKLSTFFLLIFSYLFLNEKLNKLQATMIIVAFIGTLFIIKPEFSFSFIPYLTSIIAAAFAGGAYTTLRYLGKKEEVTTTVFFFSIFTVIVLFPFVLFVFKIPTLLQLVYLLGIGVSATIGQLGTTLAYKLAPAKDVSIFNYFNVVFATIIAFFIFYEIPDFWSILGYITIFISSYTLFKYQFKNS